MTLEAIAASLKALRKAGARFVSLSYLVDLAIRGLEPEPGCVAFTIDDGYADQGVMAKEGFLANGAPVTVFLISGLLDGVLWPWDHRVEYALGRTRCGAIELAPFGKLRLQTASDRNAAIARVQDYCKVIPWVETEAVLEQVFRATGITPPPTPPESHRPLTWDEARELESAGVDFAPHWARLKQELAHPVSIYAWPTGRRQDFTARDMDIAADVGLLAAVSVTNDYARFGSRESGRASLFSASRFSMSPSMLDTIQYGTGLERLKQLVRFSL
jgi:hypothetical protein